MASVGKSTTPSPSLSKKGGGGVPTSDVARTMAWCPLRGRSPYDESGACGTAPVWSGSPTYQAMGWFPNAVQLHTGTNDYLNLGNLGVPSEGFTLTAWIQPNSTINSAAARTDFFNNGNGANGGGETTQAGFNWASDGQLAFAIYNGTWTTYKSTTSTWNANQWYHIGVAYAGGTMYIFVNGVLETSGAKSSWNNTSTNWAIGRSNSNTFTGQMADIRINKGLINRTDLYEMSIAPLSMMGSAAAPSDADTNITGSGLPTTSQLNNLTSVAGFLKTSRGSRFLF